MLLRKNPFISVPVLCALAAVIFVLLIYKFGNFREERLVKKFLGELHSGNYQQAYQTWGPSKNYTYQDFMVDWGTNGYYGKVQEFKVLDSKNRGSGVIVMVELRHLKRPVPFWVERKTHTLAFSPFEDLR